MLLNVSSRALRSVVLFALLTVAACEDDPAPSEDGAIDDGGLPDASEVDADEFDAAEVDAAEVDAAEVDAAEVDAAEVDAGELDATDGDGSTNETDADEAEGSVPAEDAEAGPLDGDVDAADAGPGDAAIEAGPGDGGTGGAACAPLRTSGEALLDLGFTGYVQQVKTAGNRLLAQDSNGHWMLWDSSSWTLIAEGERPCTRSGLDCVVRLLEMAGDVILFKDVGVLEVRASSDAHVLGSIARSAAAGLASDGSYIWTATATALETWSPTGAPLASKSGNYAGVLLPGKFVRPKIWADPAQIRVALGPEGLDTIEYVSPQTGASSESGAFLGEFYRWFDDGSHFFSYAGQTVRIYTAQAAQVKIISLASFDPYVRRVLGTGDYFWHDVDASPDRFEVYRVTGDNNPVWTSTVHRPRPLSAGETDPNEPPPESSFHGLLPLRKKVLDLRGSTVQEMSPSLPGSEIVMGITPQAKLLAGSADVVYGGNADGSSFVPLNCGFVYAVAPGPAATWAIATAKQTLVVDLQSRQLLHMIPVAARKLAFSSDGAALLAGESSTSTWWNIYDVASGEITRSIGSTLIDFDVARGSPRVAWNWATAPASFTYQTAHLDGSDAEDIVTLTKSRKMSIAPGGERLALVSGTADDFPVNYEGATDIYEGSALVGATEGLPVSWLDDTHLLVMAYQNVNQSSRFLEARIVDPQGAILSRPPLPELRAADVLEGGLLINANVAAGNSILEVASGNTVWTTPTPPTQYNAYRGRANDDYVVYWGGTQVRFVAR